VKRDFKLDYKYSDIEVKVATVVQEDVGIDHVDDPAGYDYLYNFQEKVIKFRDDNKPGDEVVVDISGYPYVPVVVEAKDHDSIETFGRFCHRIIDKRIKTKKAARERGVGELKTYASKISEGSFETYESGLEAGQLINIQSDIRNLDEDFLINRVSIRMRGPAKFIYRVSLVTTKTFGIIELLSHLLLADNRDIEISKDEVPVVDKLWTVEDQFQVQDKTPVTRDRETGPWYVGGPGA
ncbi:unnamed protein product, partial [marine sediment metagenome]